VTSPTTSLPPPVDGAVTKATLRTSSSSAAAAVREANFITLTSNKLLATGPASETVFTFYPSDLPKSSSAVASTFAAPSSQHRLQQQQKRTMSSAQLLDVQDQELVCTSFLTQSFLRGKCN